MSIRSAGPADIKVLCAGAMSAIVCEMAGLFGRTAGCEVSFSFATSAAVKNRMLEGESADVVITTKAALDELIRAGKIAADSGADIARSSIGVAVRTGAAKPDIGSVELFKQALLSAKSVAYADPATGSPSANHLVQVLARLGIAAELEPKTKRVGAAPGSVVVVGELVASGEAEIGIQQVSEIIHVSGVELAGLLPTELQQVTTFSAAVGSKAKDPQAARAFVQFLTSPAAAPVIEKNGMKPG